MSAACRSCSLVLIAASSGAMTVKAALRWAGPAPISSRWRLPGWKVFGTAIASRPSVLPVIGTGRRRPSSSTVHRLEGMGRLTAATKRGREDAVATPEAGTGRPSTSSAETSIRCEGLTISIPNPAPRSAVSIRKAPRWLRKDTPAEYCRGRQG